MRRHQRFTSLVVATATVLALSPGAKAQWTKLSGTAPAFADVQPPPPLAGTGRLTPREPPFRISPDGSRVVFVQDRTTDDVFELWSVPLSGGVPVRLNALLPTGAAVFRYRISPDSSRVVYLAPQDSASQPELYSVPIDGPFSAAVQLNPELPAGVSVGDFEISFDGSRVVFTSLGTPLSDSSWPKLYSVPLLGGAVVTLAQGPMSLPSPLRGPVLLSPQIPFEITPDGAQVVFVHDPDAGGAAVSELYRIPIGGGTAVLVNDPLPTTARVRDFGLSPDGTRVWYIADALSDEVFELFSVPLAGGGAVRINGPLATFGNVEAARFTPDGSRIVYIADQLVSSLLELFSSPATVGAAVKISGTLVDSVIGSLPGTWGLTSSGSHVVYLTFNLTTGQLQIFGAPVAGGAEPRRLHRPLFFDGTASLFRTSPVDDRVAVSAREHAAAPTHLYVTDAGGGLLWRVSPDLTATGGVLNFQFTPSGSMLVAALRLADTDSTDLYFLPAVWDPAPPRVSPPFPGGQAAGALTFPPDAGELLFTGDLETDDEIELFSTEAVLFASGFEAGHAWSWSSRTHVPTAAHGVCTTGIALAPAAGECIAAVCSHDPFCCDGAGGTWDPICVDTVVWACDGSCP